MERHKKYLIVLFWILVTSFLCKVYFGTFKYSNDAITLSVNIWSDFLTHLPTIRMFTYGDVFPLEYPLWAGEGMRYHFFFYMLVGYLEKIGFNLGFSLNILSVLGMLLFLGSIYWLSFRITKSTLTGILTVVFTLFNSSLSWLSPLKKYGLNPETFMQVVNNTQYYSFGPWDSKIISAFQNLNIYINQRHLPLSYGCVFLILFWLFYRRNIALKYLAILVAMSLPLLNRAVLPILLMGMGTLWLFTKNKIVNFFWVILITLSLVPGLIFLGSTSSFTPRLEYGYLMNTSSYQDLNVLGFSELYPLVTTNNMAKFIVYWYFNLGLLPVFAVFGLMFLYAKDKKIITDATSWFLIGFGLLIAVNVFQITAELAAQHKLVNFSIAILNIYAAYFISRLITSSYSQHYLKAFTVFVGLICMFLMILGGFVDIFPLLNSHKIPIKDVQKDKVATWIFTNTSSQDNFMNLTYSTLPISLTGRKIYYGWPYFTWGNGYNTAQRELILRQVISGIISKDELCNELVRNNMKYIFVDEPTFMETTIDLKFLETNFTKVFKYGSQTMYSAKGACNF